MRQLHKNEITLISAGCSACQQNSVSITAGIFMGTLSGMAVTWGLMMLPASLPVAIGSGILTSAGTSYYVYHQMMDSF